MSHRVERYPSRVALAGAVADLVAGLLAGRIAAAGRAHLAVPGGTTPGPMLARLGQAALDWDRVAVTLTDERWVGHASDRSNQRLLAGTLFAGPAAAAEFVPLYGATADPGASLPDICRALERLVLPLDVAVLGMGADMHTASLFPGAVGLAEALAPDAPPAVAITAPGQPERRVTLSARALTAPHRHILITGAEKLAALDRAAGADPATAPVAALLPGATVHYVE